MRKGGEKMMGRQWFLTSSLLVVALSAIFWVLGGCSAKLPSIGSILAPASPLPSNYISDFENNKPTLNPLLQGGSSGNIWRAATFGGPGNAPNKVNFPIVAPNTVADATDGSLYAIHVFATLIAAGTGCGYESDQLVCPLYHGDTNTYFDASAFTGIQFLINIGSDDTNTNPVFQVVVAETEPPPALDGTAGGTCVQGPCGSNCFNHYQASLGGVTKGSWQTVSLTWAMFNSPFNAPPFNLTYYLKHVIFLQWTFSDNVPSGITTNTDFWIDNVQFLP